MQLPFYEAVGTMGNYSVTRNPRECRWEQKAQTGVTIQLIIGKGLCIGQVNGRSPPLQPVPAHDPGVILSTPKQQQVGMFRVGTYSLFQWQNSQSVQGILCVGSGISQSLLSPGGRSAKFN